MAAEKGDRADVGSSTRVSCLQENIVEDVGDGEWLRGFSTNPSVELTSNS